MSSPRDADAGSHDGDGETRGRSPAAEEAFRGGPAPGHAAEAPIVDAKPGDTTTSGTGSELLDSIERLKKQQRDMKAERKRLAAELRNAEKRRARLRKKAKQLSVEDLVDVLKMRACGASSSSGTSRSAAPGALLLGGGAACVQSAIGESSKKDESVAK